MSQLTVEMLGIDAIKPHPENPRRGDVAAIAESLERFGQVKPIVVQKSTGYVIAGNHTREAAKSLGWTEIAAVVLDVDDETAKAYLVADNRLADRGDYDAGQLYQLLEGMLDLDGTGYDMDYIDSLADAVGATVVDETDTGEVQKVAVPPPKPKRADQKEAREKGEPMRDVVMLMTVSRAQAFGEKVAKLQKEYGTRTLVDTVERAVDEAVERL